MVKAMKNLLPESARYWPMTLAKTRSPESRIARVDHRGPHSTTYTLLTWRGELVPIRCETICMMERT
jgi:hypothetical protein